MKEFDWLLAHPEIESQYAGEYIAIAKAAVVAHGKDFNAMLQEAERHGKEPLIHKVPVADAEMSAYNQQRKCFWDRVWAADENHGFWEKVSPEVVELIRVESPEKRPDVLDLGCGLGRNAIVFAESGFHVTATDLSAAAVSHLQEWAGKLGLHVRALVCDFVDDPFPPESFDIVLSINVIYHARRTQVVRGIANVRRWLKHGGIFYFTFPSREDGEYGKGEELAPHTFELESGHVHYHADEKDLEALLDGFRILSRNKRKHHWDRDGVPQFSSRWRVMAEKP